MTGSTTAMSLNDLPAASNGPQRISDNAPATTLPAEAGSQSPIVPRPIGSNLPSTSPKMNVPRRQATTQLPPAEIQLPPAEIQLPPAETQLPQRIAAEPKPLATQPVKPESSPRPRAVSVPTTMVSTPSAERSQAYQGRAALNLAELPMPAVPALPDMTQATPTPSSDLPALPERAVPEAFEPATPGELPHGNVAAAEPPLPQQEALPELPANASLSDTPPSDIPVDLGASQPLNGERLKMATPRIEVLLDGPSDLPVGVPAQYSVVVHNDDSIDLSGLILRLDVPLAWPPSR